MDTTATSVQLTVDQAATLANVSAKTIRRWIASKRLIAALDQNRRDRTSYVIDQGDLERAMRAEPADVSTGRAVPIGGTRTLAVPVEPEGFARALTQALSSAFETPLLDRLERQAQHIGQLEAELARATAPKAPRRPRGPSRPRVSVPADDPLEAAAALARRFQGEDLARLRAELDDRVRRSEIAG